jgi:hypothetical protein
MIFSIKTWRLKLERIAFRMQQSCAALLFLYPQSIFPCFTELELSVLWLVTKLGKSDAFMLKCWQRWLLCPAIFVIASLYANQNKLLLVPSPTGEGRGKGSHITIFWDQYCFPQTWT